MLIKLLFFSFSFNSLLTSIKRYEAKKDKTHLNEKIYQKRRLAALKPKELTAATPLKKEKDKEASTVKKKKRKEKEKPINFIAFSFRYYVVHLILLIQAVSIVAGFLLFLKLLHILIQKRWPEKRISYLFHIGYLLEQEFYFKNTLLTAIFLLPSFFVYHLSQYLAQNSLRWEGVNYYTGLCLFIFLSLIWAAIKNRKVPAKYRKWHIFSLIENDEKIYWTSFFVFGFFEWLIYNNSIFLFDVTLEGWKIKSIRKQLYQKIKKESNE